MKANSILAILFASTAAISNHIESNAQTCPGNVTTTLVAVPVTGSRSAVAATLPWPDAPAQPQNLRISVVQESTGEVLGNVGGGMAASIVPQFSPATDGNSATVGLVIDMLTTPLGGAKLVQFAWQEKEQNRTACTRVRLSVAPPNDPTHNWIVNGTEVDALPANGTLNAADLVQLRVSAQGLWRDVQLELDQRLKATAGPPTLASDGSVARATYRITFPAGPIRAEGARYAAQLKSEGWADPVRLRPVSVRGGVPQFLPNPESGGDYLVATSSSSPTITLQGQNLGLSGEEGGMVVRIRAFNTAGQQIDERAPLSTALSACAQAGRQCLTLTFERPDAGARRYEVRLTSADGQTTANPAVIKTQSNLFALSKVQSEFADRTVVFAGLPAAINVDVDAANAGQQPAEIRIDGQSITGWTANPVGTSLALTNVAIPALTGEVDRAQRSLSVIYPNGNTGVGSLIVMRVPEIASNAQPVRIYGGRPQTVTVAGNFLSDVTLLPGGVVTPTQVTSGPANLTLTLGTAGTAPSVDQLPLRRLNERLGNLSVQVVARPAISQAIRLGATKTQQCGATGNQPFDPGRPVNIPAGGSLCVWILPDLSVSPGVRDSVRITLSHEGTAVGAPVEILYNARDGVAGVLVPVSGVDPGSPVDVALWRADERATGSARTTIRQRIGFFATLTGAQLRPFRSSKGRAANEEWRPTSADNALSVGLGLYLRPTLTNRYLTGFAGFTQSTRSFCQGTQRATTVQQPAWIAGVSFRWVAAGIGGAVSPAKIPASCTNTTESPAPTVDDGGSVWFFIGPSIRL